MKRTPLNKISKKKLERSGGKIPYSTLGRSFSGRTVDFDSANRGSIPRRPSKESRLLRGSKYSIDGQRYVASDADWQRIRHTLGYMAHERCEFCGHFAPVESDHFRVGEADHIYGRGGGKREDRILVVVRDESGKIVQFKRFLQWLCAPCHRYKHNPEVFS